MSTGRKTLSRCATIARNRYAITTDRSVLENKKLIDSATHGHWFDACSWSVLPSNVRCLYEVLHTLRVRLLPRHEIIRRVHT